MFGSKQSKIEKLVLKGKWDKINKKYLNGDAKTRLLLAQACAKAKDMGVNNILAVLLRDPDEKVQLAAIKSIGITGRDHEAAQLQWIIENTPAEKTEIIDAAKEAFSMVRGRK